MRQLSWRRLGKLANKSGLFWTDTGLWSDQGTRVAQGQKDDKEQNKIIFQVTAREVRLKEV